MIDIQDIAWSISRICRFNGHTSEFYTVAEHSVRISRLCDPEDAIWGLLHDAHEAYVGDVAAPLKQLLPEYQIIEARAAAIIYEKYKRFLGKSSICPEKVEEFDLYILGLEARDLMGDPEWARSGAFGDQAGGQIYPWSIKVAENAFIVRYLNLCEEK